MFRQKSQPAKRERKFEFLCAILECQIGNPKIDFVKLAERLGYKNERCASDSYYRFCREHLGGGRVRTKGNDGKSKQKYHVDGRVISGKGKGVADATTNRDDDEDPHNEISDSESSDTDGGDRKVVLKIEDVRMDGLSLSGPFLNPRIINLVEPDEWGHKEDVIIKTEPEIKKERTPEVWVW